MLFALLATMIVLVCEATLATFVATRAWDYRPARLFVPVTASLAILNIAALLLNLMSTPASVYAVLSVTTLTLSFLCAILTLFFAAVFMPELWEGTRPIRWITLPYAFATGVLLLDLLGRLGWIFGGAAMINGIYRLVPVRPGATIMLALFTGGWLVQLAILALAFLRNSRVRLAIGMLFLAIVLGSAIGLLADRLELPERLGGLVQTLLLLGALAFAVVRTHLFTPTRAAIDLALGAMSEAIAVLDQAGKVIYANPQGAALGLAPDRQAEIELREAGAEPFELATLLAQTERAQPGATQALTLGTRRIEFSSAPVFDQQGQALGLLLLGRDVTDITLRTAQLEQERARLVEIVDALEAGQRERAQLVETVRGLSLPLIPVLDGVLVLPLTGAFDSARVDEFAEVLLQGIERSGARLVLLDLTGMPLIDQAAAAGLLRGKRAAELLGARVVLVGIRPEIAEELVALGAPLGTTHTAATLQQALRTELGLGKAPPANGRHS